jgi:flavin-dependent dehydrogenase
MIDVAIVGGEPAGLHWLLIGDADGHVNPIMGEGIIYALLDGELAAHAIIDKNCQQFDMLWRKSYGQALFRDIALQKWLYSRLGLEFYCLALGLQNKLHL